MKLVAWAVATLLLAVSPALCESQGSGQSSHDQPSPSAQQSRQDSMFLRRFISRIFETISLADLPHGIFDVDDATIRSTFSAEKLISSQDVDQIKSILCHSKRYDNLKNFDSVFNTPKVQTIESQLLEYLKSSASLMKWIKSIGKVSCSTELENMLKDDREVLRAVKNLYETAMLCTPHDFDFDFESISRSITVPHASPAIADSIKHFCFSTFTDSFYKMRMRIIARIIALPPGLGNHEQLVQGLLAAGPGLQKIFQLISDRVESADFRQSVGKVKAEIPFMDVSEKNDVLKLAECWKDDFSEDPAFPDKHLDAQTHGIKAASVGQVHLVRIKSTSSTEFGNVVVKLMRKTAMDMLSDERRRVMDMLTLPQFNQLKTYWSIVLSDWEAELDWAGEYDRAKRGQIVYASLQKHGVHVSKMLGKYPSENPVMLIQEKAPGVGLDNFKPQEAYKGRDVQDLMVKVSHLYRSWIHNALFGQCFFHGDLHNGNVFFDYQEKDGQVSSTLTLIDWGNAPSVPACTDKIAAPFLLVLFGVATCQVGIALRGFGMTSANAHQKHWAGLRAKISKVFALTKEDIIAQNEQKRSVDGAPVFSTMTAERMARVTSIASEETALIKSQPHLVPFIRAKLLVDGMFYSTQSLVNAVPGGKAPGSVYELTSNVYLKNIAKVFPSLARICPIVIPLAALALGVVASFFFLVYKYVRYVFVDWPSTKLQIPETPAAA